VKNEIESDEPFVPLGLFPPAPEERINNIFGNKEEDDESSYSGFFVTDVDDDLRISSRIHRERSNQSNTSNDSRTDLSLDSNNSSGTNSRVETTNPLGISSSPQRQTTGKLRCSIM